MNNEEKILSMLENMQSQMGTMQSQIGTMQNDISGMKSDIQSLHESVVVIEQEHGKKLGVLYDNMVSANETVQKVNRLQATVEELKFGEEVIHLVGLIEGKINK